MSKSQHVLKVKKGNTTYTCELYTTPAEARNNLYAGKYVRFKKGGVNLYAPLTSTLNSAAESTPLFVYKSGDNTKYCVAQKSFYKVTITAVTNASLTVKAYDGNNTLLSTWSSGAKWFPYGTKITATAAGNPTNIWATPTLKINSGSNSNNILTVNNIDITANTPTRKSYSFTVNPGSNQTVTLKYTQPGASQVSTAVSGSTRTFTVLAGTTWTASITSVTTGFNAGTLNKKSGTITASGVAITATSATRKTFTLKLNATSHQTITLKYTQPGSSQVTRTSTSSAQSWTVGYGTTWTASLAASTGYTKGTLSPGSSGTVTAATAISASAATAITHKITFTWTADGWMPTGTITYTNTSGSSVTATKPSSVTIKYNTKIKITDTQNSYRYYLKITQGSTYKTSIRRKESWTSGALTANTTFKIVGYYDEPETSSGEGSGGEGAGGGE